MRLLNRSGWIAIKTEHHRRFCKTFFVPSSIPPRVIAGARLWLPRQRKTTHPRVTIGGKLPTGNESFVRPRKKPIDELHPSKVWEGHLVKQKSLTETSGSLVRAPVRVVWVGVIATVDQAVEVVVENPVANVQHQERV